MKVFLFDNMSEGLTSFGALPRGGWTALGVLELVCTVGLIVPDALRWLPMLAVLGVAMAFVVY